MEYYSVKAFLKHFFLVKSKKYWVGQNISSGFSSRCSDVLFQYNELVNIKKKEVHRYIEN